ncbi:ABC transporter permease [Amycolatopsis sp. lyj-109]|uniref:ABC transporter permease n=1 Tax=Amycolatopsis sp. lyj-109 TaxID=2789287 RepID=UPI003978CD90
MTTRRTWRPGLVLSAAFLVVVVLAALVPQLFTHLDPDAADPAATLLGPGAGHPLGTDQNGRDLLARIVFGTRPSLLIGLGASALGLAAGTVLGVLAARGGRVGDEVVSRLLDVLLSIPGLLLVILVVAVLGAGTGTSIVGLAVIVAPAYARLVRGEILRIRGSAFVEAAHALGWPKWQVVLRHLLPNAVGPVLVLATLSVGATIAAGASLSFLGLGPQPPTAEWGAMLAASRDYYAVAWWPAVFPGLALTATVLATTVTGQYLQRRLEGRSAR